MAVSPWLWQVWCCSLALWLSMTDPASSSGPAYIGLLIPLTFGFSFSITTHGTTPGSKVRSLTVRTFALWARQHTRVQSAIYRYPSSLSAPSLQTLFPLLSKLSPTAFSQLTFLVRSKLCPTVFTRSKFSTVCCSIWTTLTPYPGASTCSKNGKWFL